MLATQSLHQDTFDCSSGESETLHQEMEAPPKSCPCGQDDQSPSYPVHFTTIGCPNHEGRMDPWQFTGLKDEHASEPHAEFIRFCKEKLPKRELPIRIGWTSYVNADSTIFNEPNGWFLDEFGRVVILLDGVLMFQRFTQGDILMGSANGISYSDVRPDNLVEFKSRVQDFADGKKHTSPINFRRV